MIREIVSATAYVLSILIFLRAIISFFITDRNNPIVEFLVTTTEPILAPLRRIVPRMGMWDLSPMIAIVILYFIRVFINSA